MMKRSPVKLALSALVLAAALSACSSPDGFSIFDREQTADDQLPSDFDSIDTADFDLATARYSGTHDGTDFFLIRENSDSPASTPCIAIAAGKSSSIACGGLDGGVTAGGPGYEAQLVEEPARDGDGWVAISDNVRVRAEPGTTQ